MVTETDDIRGSEHTTFRALATPCGAGTTVARAVATVLPGLRESALVLGVTLAYFLTRGALHGREAIATAHAAALLLLEDRLHLAWEYAVQRLMLDHSWLRHAADAIYVGGHLPVLLAVAIWLYRRRPIAYRQMRNAILLSAAIGLAIYVSLPVAPPRFLPGFVDTLRLDGLDVDGSAVGPFYNPYAAMPSLHVAWAFLSGAALAVEGRRRWLRALGVLLPLGMMLAVVATGNHFLLDVAAGLLVALVALLVTLSQRTGA